MGNPIRFYLSVFLAVFTGVITYSLGQLNAEQYINDVDSEENRTESSRTIEALKANQAELNRAIMALRANQIESNRTVEALRANQIESNRTVEALRANEIESSRTIEALRANEIESSRTIEALRANEIDLKGARNDFEEIANSFLPSFLQWESFIGKKKKERNGYEVSIETMANDAKLGKLVTVRDYLKTVKQ